MRGALSVKIGAWVLFSLNILMAFGSIWIFMRMAPAIEEIIVKNQVSLEACEEMLAALVMRHEQQLSPASRPQEAFRLALERARNNITESEEPEIIARIEAIYGRSFAGDGRALTGTVAAIGQLSSVNRTAMKKADAQARQLGYAGAWGVVFMASLIFLAGMVFLRKLRLNLVEPLLEIEATLSAFGEGNPFRRCTLGTMPNSTRQLFSKVNDVLDHCCSRSGPFAKK